MFLKKNKDKLRGLLPSFPIYIELNLTELCDMKCTFCPRSEGYPNSNLHMSLETIDVIVSQLREVNHNFVIHLSGRGEPTLHKHFDKVLDKLSDFSVKMSTNGNRVDQYLDKINKNLYKVYYSIYDESKLTIEEAKAKYNFLILDKRTSNKKQKYHNRAGDIENDFTKNNPHHPKYGLFCEKPFTIVYINYNGDYNLCCNEWHNPTVMGNVHDQSIKDFFNNNPILQKFKNDLLNGTRSYSPCNNCNKRAHQSAVDILDKVIYNDV